MIYMIQHKSDIYIIDHIADRVTAKKLFSVRMHWSKFYYQCEKNAVSRHLAYGMPNENYMHPLADISRMLSW